MPCSGKDLCSNAQPRIHWTRSRARAAPGNERELVSSSTSPSVVDVTEDPVAGPHMRKLRAEIALELGEEIQIVSEEWTHSRLYADLVDDHALDSYLSSAVSGYRQDEQRWAKLPQKPSEVAELYGPIFDIVSHIISELGEPCGEGATWVVVNSHTSRFTQPKFKSLCPDMSIKATGPSFQRRMDKDDYLDGVGYGNVASVVDVRLQGRSNDFDQAIQAGFYCRQIYMRQPNRNFVRSLVITEHSVRMLHYDRSGFYFTPLINIHNNPRTFIRLVLGLSSPDESVLGLDTSIQWTINPATGTKTAGIIKSIDADGQPITYNLDMGRPPFYRGDVFGRGTTCWYANHPETGSEVAIKDIWRTRGKTSECDFLTAAQGVDGVVQMISFEDHCAETLAYRPPGFRADGFEPRVKSRTTMPHYGKSIQHFTSRYQVISALRDALAGYRALRAKGILHRDVSSHNILLGSPGAATGRRGVLIDLDMSAWTWDLTRLRAETGLGQRRYQSTAVLHNYQFSLPPRHDHLDDLESFFHVLCNLVLLYEGPGEQSKKLRETLARCETLNDVTAVGSAKINFLCRPWAIRSWWGQACKQLFRRFQIMVDDIGQQKHCFYMDETLTPEAKRDGMEAIAEANEDIYDKVIELFDDALAAIEKEEASAVPATAPADSVVAEKQPAIATNLKRRSIEEHSDAAPPSKRLSPPATTQADSPVAAKQPATVTNLKKRSVKEHPDAPPPKRPSPTSPKDSDAPENPPQNIRSRPPPRPSARSDLAAVPTPTLAPPTEHSKAASGHGDRSNFNGLSTDALPKRTRPTARVNRRKRGQDASPSKAVRRSARLNRV
ncbi:hypothetical protein DFP72DRAFT_1165873 [Ephemerocybe angulata]|uniref:Protein kinase domain-containing protein n=1 Tax=Ephemerocybe angulata TaxID=980116 RepID=A0A8H6MA52_9AGAR|nr:hypothetical protein DFP72DRAFT_1165873 [Tulosesus angulatus]